MRIDVLTTFTDLFSAQAPAVLGVSIPARAIAAGALSVHATDIRAHADNKHDKTDDRPFGGGPGMVMMCQPLWDAAMHAESLDPAPTRRVLLTPQGEPLTQQRVHDLARSPRLMLICGHYEGIDQRVIDRLDPLELSVGDYVLSSGELAALVLIDAVARLLPGVLGHADSALQDSFDPAPTTDPNGDPLSAKITSNLGIPENAKLLDCPHYTRPREWDGREAPEILFSGDHAAVARWRLEQQLARTRDRRPDMLAGETLDPDHQ